jgi:AcrR family transcriptional regulator
VVTALVDLLCEGGPPPNAAKVAERAGVSPRSIYVHFDSMEDLYRAATEHVTALIVSLLEPIDPDQPLAARIALLCGQRARINEQVGRALHAADLHQSRSPELTRARDFGRQSSRTQIERVFARELGAFDLATRRRRVAGVDALVAEPAWALLRTSHSLSADEARLATEEAVAALLGAD